MEGKYIVSFIPEKGYASDVAQPPPPAMVEMSFSILNKQFFQRRAGPVVWELTLSEK